MHKEEVARMEKEKAKSAEYVPQKIKSKQRSVEYRNNNRVKMDTINEVFGDNTIEDLRIEH